MRNRRAMAKAAVLLTAFVVVALAFAVAGSQPAHHLDGAGALASLNGPGSESMAINPAVTGYIRYTYGFRLCRAGEGDPGVIRGVAPKATVGTGFAYLGSRVRTFRPTDTHTPIISTDGFPPPEAMVPDHLDDAIGRGVATSCDAPYLDEYTELLVGLELTSPDGGGWQGILIAYDVDGRQSVLEVDRGLLLCGTSYPVCN